MFCHRTYRRIFIKIEDAKGGKFIDARGDLSVQVHPDDAMAQREHGKFGKTEMWYVLDAEPGACLYSGFKEELSAFDYKRRVEDEYRTEYSTEENRANRVVESPFFSVRVTELEEAFHRNLVKYDSFIITMCLKGDCRIRIRSTQEEVMLKEGFSCLIPAAIADYDVVPGAGRSRVLDAFIDNMDRSITGRITRFLHITS